MYELLQKSRDNEGKITYKNTCKLALFYIVKISFAIYLIILANNSKFNPAINEKQITILKQTLLEANKYCSQNFKDFLNIFGNINKENVGDYANKTLNVLNNLLIIGSFCIIIGSDVIGTIGNIFVMISLGLYILLIYNDIYDKQDSSKLMCYRYYSLFGATYFLF